VADESDEVAAVGVAARLCVHLRDQRTDGVHDDETAPLAVLLYRRRDPVGGEHADRPLRYLVLGIDEDGAEPLEPLDDVVVVDDLMANVDRRAVLVEKALDDLDRSVDAGAERARGGEEDLHADAHLFVAAARQSSARLASAAARAKPRGSRAKARTRPGQS
jgi:hypothetical protein